MMHRHQVSTNRTGLHRVVQVRLYDTTDEMRADYARRFPDDHEGIHAAEGLFITPATWDDRDPRPGVGGQMWLALDYVTMTAIVHEATHAALHIYSIDGYRTHARASAHVSVDNEAVPYLVGDLASAVALLVNDRLHDLGRALDVGRGRYYADHEHPAYLPRHAED